MILRIIFPLILLFVCFSINPSQSKAQSEPFELLEMELVATDSATPSAQATESATASQTASLVIQEKKDKDITETGGKQKDKLVMLLEENPVTNPSPLNILQRAIRTSVENGVPANTIVLLLIFPIVSFFIAFSRHMIGLRGFGVYTPAVLAVAFVSTGIFNGITLFLIVLATTMIARKVMRHLKLQYLPRTAMMMWAVSIGVLLFLLTTGFFGMSVFYSLNIFTILIIMLLSENFMETQLMSSQSEAIRLTVETIFLATISSFLIASTTIQQAVILNPELTLIIVAFLNIAVGKYSGLRLLEYLRFKDIIEK